MIDAISRSAVLAVGNVRKVVEYDEAGYDVTYLAVPADAIERLPALDVVPVVRCKDCKYWHQYLQECKWTGTTMAAEDYCSEAEQKEEEEHE